MDDTHRDVLRDILKRIEALCTNPHWSSERKHRVLDLAQEGQVLLNRDQTPKKPPTQAADLQFKDLDYRTPFRFTHTQHEGPWVRVSPRKYSHAERPSHLNGMLIGSIYARVIKEASDAVDQRQSS